MKSEPNGLKTAIKYTIGIGLVVICVGLMFTKDSSFGDNLVIGFFGMLATFVVIGNFSQVSHIIRENKDTQEELNKKMETFTKNVNDRLNEVLKATMYDNGTSKIEDLLEFKNDFNTSILEIKKQTLLDYQENIEDVTQKEFTNIVEALVYLTNGTHRVLVSNIVSNKKDVKYNIKRTKEEKSIMAHAVWDNNKLIFKDKDGKMIEDVQIVSNKTFDYPTVCRILSVLMRSNKGKDNRQSETKQSISDWIYESV